MAEQLLDRAQVGAALEQVRRERVAEAVRVRHQAAQRRGVEPAAAGREEERVVGAAGELGARLAEVAGDPVGGLLAERDDPVLRALAVADVDVLLLEVDVAEIEPDRLRAAQAGRVDELEQRPVADRERLVAVAERVARIASTSSAFGASGRRRPRRCGERDVRARWPGPSEKRSSERTAESRRAIVAGASLPPGRARPRSAV